ncbi:hypothetical protein [Salinicoccus roseus]|uniref:hypothetical protein n=1 Tax=Salinicoccus roseus TaxID=45670 RepID=UPI0022FFE3CF|nr:hypothetical protein [Salinicoccus roseus]
MHADPTLPVVKVKSIEVTVNATVDVAYVDDFDDERNKEYIDRQVKDAIRKANMETSELVDLELDDY